MCDRLFFLLHVRLMHSILCIQLLLWYLFHRIMFNLLFLVMPFSRLLRFMLRV